jgi:hypothetical protein
MRRQGKIGGGEENGVSKQGLNFIIIHNLILGGYWPKSRTDLRVLNYYELEIGSGNLIIGYPVNQRLLNYLWWYPVIWIRY